MEELSTLMGCWLTSAMDMITVTGTDTSTDTGMNTDLDMSMDMVMIMIMITRITVINTKYKKVTRLKMNNLDRSKIMLKGI